MQANLAFETCLNVQYKLELMITLKFWTWTMKPRMIYIFLATHSLNISLFI